MGNLEPLSSMKRTEIIDKSLSLSPCLQSKEVSNNVIREQLKSKERRGVRRLALVVLGLIPALQREIRPLPQTATILQTSARQLLIWAVDQI